MNNTSYLMLVSSMIQMVDTMMMNQDLEWTKDLQSHMSPQLFRHDFQTVVVNAPRRTGHTTVAEHCWVQYNALVLHPRYDDARRFERQLQENRGILIDRSPDKAYQNRIFVPQPESRGGDRLKSMIAGLKAAPQEHWPQMIVFDQASRMPNQQEINEWKGMGAVGRTMDEIIHITFAMMPETMKGVIALQ